ncbi:MAG: phosphoribosylanthranilate isomerase [Gemmatimonadaceae bacterium]
MIPSQQPRAWLASNARRVRVDVKVCGLMRPQDADAAARAGASFLGVIFAASKRQLQPSAARDVLDGDAQRRCKRVGVFGPSSCDELLATASAVDLDVLQLHHPPADWQQLRAAFRGEVWGVVRIAVNSPVESHWRDWERADGIVLDTFSRDALGGTGTTFDWAAAASTVGVERRGARLVLAGGLTPANVATAVGVLRPHVVDVSSGVEESVGVKDHAKIAQFIAAAQAAASSLE